MTQQNIEKETELRMLIKFEKEVKRLVNSFEEGAPNHKIFNFEDKYIQDNWNKAHQAGKYAMLNKFSFELGCLLGELLNECSNKWKAIENLSIENEENQ